MFEVRVPATSANLGPGFDSLGLALNIYGRFVFTQARESVQTNHLCLLAYKETLAALGAEGPPLFVRSTTSIPPGKGLGSSAACILAGVYAAFHLSGQPFEREAMLAQAARIEGHPDNVAPALLGGLVTAGWQAERLLTGRFAVSNRLSFALLLPSFGLATTRARQALPETVSFGDAVYNLSQLGRTLSALASGDEALLGSAFGDRLHQPYRLPLIEEAARLMDLARENGALAVALSGAGPALLLVRRRDDQLDRLRKIVRAEEKGWTLKLCELDRVGAVFQA